MAVSEEQMVALNRRQARFYDLVQVAEEETGLGGYAHNEDANMITRLWAAMRYQQQRAVESTGIRDRMRRMHKEWFDQTAGGSFLEIGCFSASEYTFDMIDSASDYTGIELSAKACASLRQKIDMRELSDKATVVCGDLLEYTPNRKFDLIYAHGVLHHFENPKPLFSRVRDLIATGGVLVFVEPVAINPLYRVLRAAYRPFQSDAAWEWPFRRQTVAELTERFVVVDGFGWGRFSAPLSVFSGIPGVCSAYRWIACNELAEPSERGYWLSSMVLAKCRPI